MPGRGGGGGGRADKKLSRSHFRRPQAKPHAAVPEAMGHINSMAGNKKHARTLRLIFQHLWFMHVYIGRQMAWSSEYIFSVPGIYNSSDE